MTASCIQLRVGYPAQADEVAIVRAQTHGHPIASLKPMAALDELKAMSEAAQRIHTDPSVFEYIVKLVRATREREELALGASPRASVGLHHMARAMALIGGEAFVRPDHVKAVAPAVLRHRIILTPQARLADLSPDQVIDSILDSVEIPLYTDA